MKRHRALGYSLAVTVAVFVALAMPTLRAMFGPVAILVVYAGVALVAGGLTYSWLPRVASWLDRDVGAGEPAAEGDADAAESDAAEGEVTGSDAADDEGADETDEAVEPEDPDVVRQEIEQLREEL